MKLDDQVPILAVDDKEENLEALSHGHNAISQDDLKTDMKTGSTEQIRAAATIAEQHFSDLDRISDGHRIQPVE